MKEEVKFTPKACDSHKPVRLSYLQWCKFVEEKKNNNEEQVRCDKCGRWFFKEEM